MATVYPFSNGYFRRIKHQVTKHTSSPAASRNTMVTSLYSKGLHSPQTSVQLGAISRGHTIQHFPWSRPWQIPYQFAVVRKCENKPEAWTSCAVGWSAKWGLTFQTSPEFVWGPQPYIYLAFFLTRFYLVCASASRLQSQHGGQLPGQALF